LNIDWHSVTIFNDEHLRALFFWISSAVVGRRLPAAGAHCPLLNIQMHPFFGAVVFM